MEYEVRLFHSDGSLSVIMAVQASDDIQARLRVAPLLSGNISNATIRCGDVLIDALYDVHAIPPANVNPAGQPCRPTSVPPKVA
jgi:hypothetical protein